MIFYGVLNIPQTLEQADILCGYSMRQPGLQNRDVGAFDTGIGMLRGVRYGNQAFFLFGLIAFAAVLTSDFL